MREEIREANVVVAKCTSAKKLYGIRVEKKSFNNWFCNWAFKLSEKGASNEGYDETVISGQIDIDSEYPGCPYCGAGGWFVCGGCQKLNCYDGRTQIVSCQWCGGQGELYTVESFDIRGGGY